MFTCGDTFLAGEEDDQDLHLWIIVTPPYQGEVVTVSVTTKRRTSETLVVLPGGCHPFINRDSVISYGYSKIRFVSDIEAAVQNGTAKKREPVSPELLKRVQTGLRDSDFTPNGVRHFYKDVLGS
jgi:hypothetical protein